jgi:hypothetical protein
MDIKQYKLNLETKIKDTIKSLVDEKVEVNASYDLERDIISVFLIEERQKEEVRESIVVYNCIFAKETNLLTVIGFVRRYMYDNFGIASIVNEPVAVDENFINGIKGAIFAALQPEMVAADSEEVAN